MMFSMVFQRVVRFFVTMQTFVVVDSGFGKYNNLREGHENGGYIIFILIEETWRLQHREQLYNSTCYCHAFSYTCTLALVHSQAMEGD